MENTEIQHEMPTVNSSSSNSSKKMILVGVAAAVVLIVLGVFSFRAGLWGKFGSTKNQTGGPVATVNGEEVSRETFDARLQQMTAQYKSQGMDVSSPENTDTIKNQVVQNLVDETLLTQAATEAGITVSDEDVNSEFDTIATQYGGADAFSQALIAQNVTEDAVRSDLRGQLLLQKYLEQEIDIKGITASDEEVQEAYDSVASQNKDVPAFEDVKSVIHDQLVQQKTQNAVAAFIQTLRDKGLVTILL